MINPDKYKKLLLPVFMTMLMVACGGGDGSSDAETTQPPVSENRTAVHAMAQSSNGSLLKGVTLSILGQQAQTNENGIAQLNVNLPKGLDEVVVKYEAEGFITQSVLVKTTELGNLTANLLAAKDAVSVNNIENAQVISSRLLGATITIPANAFVKANGSFAQGKVNVELTPWDITSSDLNAMPANGFAMDVQGNRTQLISAGMITATFKDAATGEKLQLASGKTADIQMDLPLKSINNQEMKVGTEIPMWHFDEAKGLWVEEGKGHVVASITSASGLAVHAKVSHFSTWNWDFKVENGGSVFVQCQLDGQAAPCTLNANVTLNDESKLNYFMSIGSQGGTIINMPSSGSILWTGKDSTGYMIGEKVSGTSGTIIIDLGKPTTDNFVKCFLPNGNSIACVGKINNALDFSISNEGGRLITQEKDTINQLNWSANTPFFFENGEWVRYQGTAKSSSHQNVNIGLNQKIKADKGKTILIHCWNIDGCSGVITIVDGEGKMILSDQLTGQSESTIEYVLPKVSNETRVSIKYGSIDNCSSTHIIYGDINEFQIFESMNALC